MNHRARPGAGGGSLYIHVNIFKNKIQTKKKNRFPLICRLKAMEEAMASMKCDKCDAGNEENDCIWYFCAPCGRLEGACCAHPRVTSGWRWCAYCGQSQCSDCEYDSPLSCKFRTTCECGKSFQTCRKASCRDGGKEFCGEEGCGEKVREERETPEPSGQTAA